MMSAWRLVRPHHLRNAKPTQRAGGRIIGVDGVIVELHILDVVGTGGGKA